MNVKKVIGTFAGTVLLASALALGGAGAANAGSQSLGAHSCGGVSSLATKATGNYRITFNAYLPNKGAKTLTKGSNSDATVRTQSVYWYNSAGGRVEYANNGSASNSGSLSGTAWFCDY